MKNLGQSAQDFARQELETVNLQLIHVIAHARRWHDIRKAADAMFHARLIWDGCYGELFVQRDEGGSGITEAPMSETLSSAAVEQDT